MGDAKHRKHTAVGRTPGVLGFTGGNFRLHFESHFRVNPSTLSMLILLSPEPHWKYSRKWEYWSSISTS